jgi:adenine-specific DNA methylase
MRPTRQSCPKSLLSGLPTYFGGKRKLAPWIFSHLANVVSSGSWSKLTFIDAFLGGASISLMAKAYGFKEIYANDLAFRSKVLADAFLVNRKQKLSQEDTLAATQDLPGDFIPGLIVSHYAPAVFSLRHAEALDKVLYRAYQTQDPVKQSLLLTLLWHLALEYVCFPTSLGTSNRPYAEALEGLRSWDSLNPKRYIDGSIAHLLKPTWNHLEKKRRLINQSVLGGSPVTFSQLDALDFISRVKGDILYADPPYPGTLSYERNNRVLDSLLTGTIIEPAKTISPFTQGVDALDALLESARHIPIWVLSYGNKHISLEALVEKVKRHAPNRNVEGYAKDYRHLSHVTKNTSNQELLILAYPKTGGN